MIVIAASAWGLTALAAPVQEAPPPRTGAEAAAGAGIKRQVPPEPSSDRLPLPTDIGVAWDQIAHRGDLRWECRAVPSGKFVMTSMCVNEPKADVRWPGTRPPPGWDGMVHLD